GRHQRYAASLAPTRHDVCPREVAMDEFRCHRVHDTTEGEEGPPYTAVATKTLGHRRPPRAPERIGEPPLRQEEAELPALDTGIGDVEHVTRHPCHIAHRDDPEGARPATFGLRA